MLIIGAIVTLVIVGAMVFVVRLDEQIAQEARQRLESHVDRQAADIDGLLHRASSDIRLARRNAVFDRNILTTSNEVPQEDRTEIEAAIRYMGERYDVDEICLIRADGAEIARYDSGEIAAVDDLSPDESLNNPAFLPAMRLPDDAVHITDPYVSPDSGRWVYGLATPIILSDGSRGGVLHFEIPLQAIADQLTASEYAPAASSFLVDGDDGRLLVHRDLAAFRATAGLPQDPDVAPFPDAASVGPSDWRALVSVMLSSRSGERAYRADGRKFVVRYAPTDLDNIVGTVVPEDILLADVNRARTDLIVTLGPLVLAMLAISAWFASRLSSANQRLEVSGRASAQLAAIVVAADDAIMRCDLDGRIVTWNAGAQRMYGYTDAEAVGRSVTDLITPERRPEIDHLLAAVASGDAVRRDESVHMASDGRTFDAAVTFSPISEADGTVSGSSVVVRDISQRKRLEDELTHQALHDSLTGLPNRVLFIDRLEHALAAATRDDIELRQHHRLAVLFLDVDEFKVVNDSLGHKVGDDLLIAIGERLSRSIRPGDTAARLGGDEFTVLLESIPDVRTAETTARRILHRLGLPFEIQGHRVTVGVSIGIAVSGEGTDAAEVLRRADLALYDAKARGKGRHAVFNATMDERAWRRLELETELRMALERGELEVYYQQIFDLTTGEVYGAEALLRWPHPRHGMIMPTEFIALAEQTGLILPIGEFVLSTACKQLRAWDDLHPRRPLVMSVNVSPRQLQEPDFVGTVERNLWASQVAPDRLQLEITEGLLQEDEACIRTVARLQAIGVHVALDDFGTGYSSLASIRRLPVDSLKIDQSFVAGIVGEQQDAALVSAAVTFARAVGLELTAEGIENEEQLDALRRLGCRLGQGFHLGRPLPAAEVTRLLDEPAAATFKSRLTSEAVLEGEA